MERYKLADGTYELERTIDITRLPDGGGYEVAWPSGRVTHHQTRSAVSRALERSHTRWANRMMAEGNVSEAGTNHNWVDG